MQSIKIFIAFILPLAFAVCVSGQDKTPKIVWKNLQERYERFEDIKPIIRNQSSQPIYFYCSNDDYGSFNNYGYDGKFKLLWNANNSGWGWNVMLCGFHTPKELKRIEKREKRIEELKRVGKYIPTGCKLEPNQEYEIKFSEKLWQYIIFGEGSAAYPYGSGNYKFTLEYEWANNQNPAISESPEFFVNLEKQTN